MTAALLRGRALGENLDQKEGDEIAEMVLALVLELVQRSGRPVPTSREATGTGYLGPDVMRHVMEASR